MSTLDEIKAATERLKPEEQAELFRWWIQSDAFKARQLAALKHEIGVGIDQLEHGRYQSYDDASVMQLAEEASKSGSALLEDSRKNHSE